jgi:hypothetical protein
MTRTRTAVVAVCALLSGCATQSKADGTGPASPDPAASTAAASCGAALPVDVAVPGSVGGPTDGPADGKTSPGQIALHWTLPSGALEVRWPPDQRLLYGAVERDQPGAFDASGENGDGRILTIGDGAIPLLTLTLRAGVTGLPDRPCDRIQVRRISPNGTAETVAYRFGDGGVPFDLGPLIGNASDTPGTVAPDRSVECTDHVARSTPVTSAGSFPTPAEALRAFLESDAGAAVDGPTPPRPFHQYHVTADGTYRFEHYTNWRQHVAITVSPSGAGWAASSYAIVEC